MNERNGHRANGRWHGIERPYAAEDVLRLRGTVEIEHTRARRGAAARRCRWSRPA